MADVVDLANDAHMEQLDQSQASQRVPVARRADFCDCESWQCGNFCGDVACRDQYQAEERRDALRKGGVAAISFIQRGAR